MANDKDRTLISLLSIQRAVDRTSATGVAGSPAAGSKIKHARDMLGIGIVDGIGRFFSFVTGPAASVRSSVFES